MEKRCSKIFVTGGLFILAFLSTAGGVKPPLRPEVKHLDQIRDFPITLPGGRGAALFETSTLEMLLTVAEPGTKPHKHLLSDHVIYVLKGMGEVRLDEIKEPVTEGDLVLIPAGVTHAIVKTGREEFLFLDLSSPPLDPKDTVLPEREIP